MIVKKSQVGKYSGNTTSKAGNHGAPSLTPPKTKNAKKTGAGSVTRLKESYAPRATAPPEEESGKENLETADSPSTPETSSPGQQVEQSKSEFLSSFAQNLGSEARIAIQRQTSTSVAKPRTKLWVRSDVLPTRTLS